jgi:enterochelin esterase-like enzyme
MHATAHLHGMRAHIITFCLATCYLAGSLKAQAALSLGDSTSRQLDRQSSDSVFVALRDGDYAKVVVAHPLGLRVDVLRPNGSLLRSFNPATEDGVLPVTFAAEGEGRYAVVVTNTREAASRYGMAFKERVSLDERMRPAPWRDPLASPTIERMRKAIDAGNVSTAEFWKTIEQPGTPVVEPMDSRYDLVTFLWRGENDTRNVFVNSSVGVPNGPNDAMHRLGASDIWYLTLKLPKGARFIYQLEPNRPPAPEMARVTRQVDPLNHGPRSQCPEEEAGTYRCYSIGELPEAASDTWRIKRPGVATGSIEHGKIHSAIQDVDRDLTVYLPAGYTRTGRPNALVVLYDGEDMLDAPWNGPTMWDNLIAARRIPPIVVVMVHNIPGHRLFDLVANAAFGDFMGKELAPWIRANYNVTSDAGRTVIGGASAGGFGATYLGLAHPEVYGNVLSMSGAVWWSPEHNGGICAGACAAPGGKPAVVNKDATTEGNWLAPLALKQASVSARFFLAPGLFEFDQSGTGGNILEETRHLRDILRARNGRVIYHEFVGGHDGLSWPGMLAEGLQRLLGDAR